IELSFLQDSRDHFQKTYLLRETWLQGRHPERTSVEHGSWTFLRGTASDPEATVYEITLDGGGASRHFLLARDGSLRMLDGDMEELPPGLPHTLQPVAPGAASN